MNFDIKQEFSGRYHHVSVRDVGLCSNREKCDCHRSYIFSSEESKLYTEKLSSLLHILKEKKLIDFQSKSLYLSSKYEAITGKHNDSKLLTVNRSRDSA